jgi:NAD(P)-dependent dehydrogenase (short-subunit alcohol dehydrogenase family)
MRTSIIPAKSVIAVTGVTYGLGRGIVTALVQRGAQVIGNGRRQELGIELQRELESAPGTFRYINGDMTKQEDAEALINTALNDYGRLDVLINNVGTVGDNPVRSLSEMNLDWWEMIMATNLTSMFLGCQAAAKPLIASQGAIVNIGSHAGENTGSELLAYRAAKAGAMHFSKSLAVSMLPHHVRVHTLTMHSVETPGGESVLQHRAESMTTEDEMIMREARARITVLPIDVGHGIAELLIDMTQTSGAGYTVG